MRYITQKRTIKECTQELIRTFLFKKIPGQIIIELIRFVSIWLNQNPSDNGVSRVHSPLNIIMGQYLYYDKHCNLRFRSYVKYHEDRKIANNMEEQTVSTICLGPTENFQGRYKLFSLMVTNVVTRNQNTRESPY